MNEFNYLTGLSALRGFTLDAYQQRAMTTHSDAPERLACYALGVAGEAGEVADMIKKHIGHGHELDRDELIKELGDVLWYVAALAHLHRIPLSRIAYRNNMKLEARYPNGFSHEASRARLDVAPEGLRKPGYKPQKRAVVVSPTLARNKAKVPR